MKLYIDSNTEASIEKKILLRRREFIVFSSLMGVILSTTDVNSRPQRKYDVALGLGSFWEWLIKNAGSTGSRKIVRLWKERSDFDGKMSLAINIDRESLSSNRKRSIVSEIVKENISNTTGIPVYTPGIKYVIDNLVYKNDIEVWDQTGVAMSPLDNTIYNNKIRILIFNDSNKYTERKIQLMIISKGRPEYVKQLTVKASAFQREIFNVSNAFVNLPSSGIKEIVYKIVGNHRDIKIGAINNSILVSRMIDN